MERRSSVRVKDRLQVAYRVLNMDKPLDGRVAEDYFPPIWTKYPANLILPDDMEESMGKIIHHIVDLNQKIDILIDLLSPEQGAKIEIPKIRDVCISATGIRFTIREPSFPGQKIALCIILPFVPPVKIFVIGEVRRSVPLGDILFETGIKFLDLKDDDYERIMRYIFKRQRDMLRDKKLAQSELSEKG